ncbi:hypothetical protein [Endozoicomonas elysicola]|uniref:Lipoprotein n=1 Tax=Endozoicomonas elysicola TaxID=305900 RepID=A0A081KDW7_9GAMM|nr:hypothetical protein [Endozoicomonas elysicola]KEI72343.1 hypothetical protein GV64_17850 [Endozoicomonas elysicola]
MFPLMRWASFSLMIPILLACSEINKQTSPQKSMPPPPDITQDNTLYTNMRTYGQYMGCSAAERNEGLPQAGWEQAPSLPGTYEEYRTGWQEGFNKCRIGLGPVVPPDGVYP